MTEPLSRNSVRAVRRQSGLTLVELLVAALVIAVGLLALVATWAAMTSLAIEADTRTSSFEVARLVMERARSFGYTHNGSANPDAVFLAAADSVSFPSADVTTTWQSACLQKYRFFDNDVQELRGGGNNVPGAPPPNARYLVTTFLHYTPDANALAQRSDLHLMVVTVLVQQVRANGSIDRQPLAQLQSAMTQGGL